MSIFRYFTRKIIGLDRAVVPLIIYSICLILYICNYAEGASMISNQRKVCVYGGALNPMHAGHCDAIKQALHEFDEVVIVPSIHHAFGKDMAPYADRVQMARLTVRDMLQGDGRISISAAELDIKSRQTADMPVYTYDLLSYLRENGPPNTHYAFAIGPDNAKAETWKKFYRHKDIENEFGVYIASENINVRSTIIRNLINSGITDNKAEIISYIGSSSFDYILKNNLYKQPHHTATRQKR